MVLTVGAGPGLVVEDNRRRDAARNFRVLQQLESVLGFFDGGNNSTTTLPKSSRSSENGKVLKSLSRMTRNAKGSVK